MHYRDLISSELSKVHFFGKGINLLWQGKGINKIEKLRDVQQWAMLRRRKLAKKKRKYMMKFGPK